ARVPVAGAPRRDRAALPARVHAGRDRGAARAAARNGQLAPAPRARLAEGAHRVRFRAPGEDAAGERAWEVVRAAYARREPVTRPRRHATPLLRARAVGEAG